MARRWRAPLAAAAASLALCVPAARADEGMWTFDNLPVREMRRAYDWSPDQSWLSLVQGASVRLESGCSAAFVSAEGLVQTNHHCVLKCVQDLSTPQADTVRDGVRALSRADERRCPNLALQALLSISDVTQDIEAAAAFAGPEGFARARDAEISRIESRCAGGDSSRRCEVVTLYQGGQYKLYAYKRYDDVRLVFAPELAAAFFGGDPDNFTFPRYCFDVAYLRAYENGAPAATPRYLRLRSEPLADGELTLVSGNPGTTERLLTTSQLAFQRDEFLPWRVAQLEMLRQRLRAFAARDGDHARMAANAIFGVENGLKALRGRLAALRSEGGFARAISAEQDLQARVRRNGAQLRETGAAWDEIAATITAYERFYLAYQHGEARAGGGSTLFRWARDLVRAEAERAKPDAERLPRYTEARLGATRQGVLSAAPVDAPLEALHLAFWLQQMQAELGADSPLVRAALGGEAPHVVADRLVTQTRLADPAERARLWEGGAGASDDPLLAFVRAIDPEARALRTRYLVEVEGPAQRAQERIARARFRAYGADIYPDATFSPRLSYGRVAGWTEPSGEAIAPFTRLGGLYGRATGIAPYKLAETWVRARENLPADTIFNAVTTNDIIGGNSGSPVIDRQGRLVGVAFDSNIHGLGGNYFYDPALNRTVIVAATAIDAVLRRVYGLDALANELAGTS